MKKVVRYLFVFFTVLNLYIVNINVFAAEKEEYEFIDPENKHEVNNMIDEIYEITEEYYEIYHKDDGSGFNGVYNNKFWWPIGSAETTEENGVLFAKGDPETVTITSPFGNRTDPFGSGATKFHSGLDIAGGSGANSVNIIAAKSGTVIYPSEGSPLSCPSSSGMDGCGGGFGNYVIIEHSGGIYTVYAHMYSDSITVTAGDQVSQGQVIGKMGSSGYSTGPHLHFEVRVGQNSTSAVVDPLNYISPDDPRPMGSAGGNFSVTETSLSKAEFQTRMDDYANRASSSNFRTTFANNADKIYDIATASGINPELVVVTAIAESSANYHSDNNYWGIGVPNGASSGAVFSSFEEGVQGYCDVLKSYMSGNRANTINNRAAQREAAGCDPAGYGTPDTLAGQQSIYSWVGDYRFNPGNWGLGGCVYLNIIYGSNYCSTVATCAGDSGCSEASRTTVCEQNDYTAWQVNKKAQIRFDIFGI